MQVFDESFKPTLTEILDYAESLGMKMPEDACFLYIARQGEPETDGQASMSDGVCSLTSQAYWSRFPVIGSLAE